MENQVENTVDQEQPQEGMTFQQFVDYVSLQEWKVRELKAALDMYKYDQELKALQESLTKENK